MDQVADRLRDEDFYRNEHRLIYHHVPASGSSKPIDVLTVSEALQELQELEQAGGEVYLFELRITLLARLIFQHTQI